jgi:hypothetical protein
VPETMQVDLLLILLLLLADEIMALLPYLTQL